LEKSLKLTVNLNVKRRIVTERQTIAGWLPAFIYLKRAGKQRL
jgi:hypothetical protein